MQVPPFRQGFGIQGFCTEENKTVSTVIQKQPKFLIYPRNPRINYEKNKDTQSHIATYQHFVLGQIARH